MDKNNIYIQALTPYNWVEFRAMRIRAVKMHTGCFSVNPREAEQLKPEYWKDTLDGEGKQVFGLFDKNILIGITAVFTWLDDPTGKTGVMAMSFIEPEYRAKGYSSLFYDARIDFAMKHFAWSKLAISHRDNNEPSRRAMIKNGFQFIETEEIDWPDGVREIEHKYELDLEALRLKSEKSLPM